ncbi:Alpha-D-phosphohexomutase, alpha/beta/alpha domain protein I domain protein, partial [mine drainage metagenome]
MPIDPHAGQPAPPELLVDLTQLENAYYGRSPDPTDASQGVQFGTSGHRGSSLDGTFNEAHILAITQAVCDYRRSQGIDGPVLVGKDTHALSAPAERTAIEVLAANGVEAVVARGAGITPVPVISRAIVRHNRGRTAHVA